VLGGSAILVGVDRTAFHKAALKVGVDLSEDQLDRFLNFHDRLYTRNEVMNLTRIPPDEAWIKHFLDSLLFQSVIPANAKVLDIGTGPGLPAWPLACARPDLHVTGMDSNGKMLGFLLDNLLANLKAIEARAEDRPFRDEFDVVTGRALAPLAIQLEISAGPCTLNGIVAPMRTPNDEEAIRGFDAIVLGLRLEHVERRILPSTDIERVLPIYRKVKATPKKFPRPWAEIKRQPIGD
jgi:16S rRNA (guanine527-N7)-methyltransferase